ncbi:unnamed protein product [Penicillium egyptiacum]|uniref:Alanine dehydrogenase/pyridine nucleotide transhydrogenase NAD(H)-binding domain-containing protein n=1 Tax=Penicillium egyptiacum TaxID=1303716 RepID=A0A9W4KJD6_9EURO|nr:unnamed protein product [Penicillium egyptiacum]
MENPSCLLYGAGDARFENRPRPVIEDAHDTLASAEAMYVHFWLHGGIKNHVSTTNPLVMGHEASDSHRAGLRPVPTCAQCKSGKYNLCPHMKFTASPPHTHGALSKFFKVPADCCYRISGAQLRERVRIDEAVLIEPMDVAVHSVRQVGVKPSDRVVVFGAGTVGLLCAAVAGQFGASVIVSVDINKDKLDFAEDWMLPDRALFSTQLARELWTPEQIAAELRKRLKSLRLEPDCWDLSENEITAKGCFWYGAGDFKLALEMVMVQKVDLRSLITKIVPFRDAVEAWEATKRGEEIKTLIEVGL